MVAREAELQALLLADDVDYKNCLSFLKGFFKIKVCDTVDCQLVYQRWRARKFLLQRVPNWYALWVHLNRLPWLILTGYVRRKRTDWRNTENKHIIYGIIAKTGKELKTRSVMNLCVTLDLTWDCSMEMFRISVFTNVPSSGPTITDTHATKMVNAFIKRYRRNGERSFISLIKCNLQWYTRIW